MAITRYAGSNNRAWPAHETLAGDVNCSRRRVIDAVELLQRCKLIEKRKRGNRTNSYLVYPPEYFRVDADTQTLIESRLRKGKGGRPAQNGAAKKTAGGGDGHDALEAVAAVADEQVEEDPEGAQVNLVHLERFESAQEKIFSVNQVHPDGELNSPHKCSEFTTGVNSVHLKNNNKNNFKNLSPREGTCTGIKDGVSETCNPKSENLEKGEAKAAPAAIKGVAGSGGLIGADQTGPTAEPEVKVREGGAKHGGDYAAVVEAFNRKGFQASGRLIAELLRRYEREAILAVIKKTDFQLARNPAVVIKWMLSTGSYVLPLPEKKEALPPPLELREMRTPDPAEDAAIREMIKNAKAGLLAQKLQKAL